MSILKKRPDAYLVANKYKVLSAIIKRRHPIVANLSEKTLTDIIFDAVQGNREWQQLSEGHDALQKQIRDQQWRIDHGYHDLPPTVTNTPPRGT